MPLAAADFLSLKQNKKCLSTWCGFREMWVQTWPLVTYPLQAFTSEMSCGCSCCCLRLRGEAVRVVLPQERRWGSLLGARAQIHLPCLSPCVTRYVLILSPLLPQVSSHRRTGSISSTSQPSHAHRFLEIPGPLHEVTPGASADQVSSPALSLAAGAAWYGEVTVPLLPRRSSTSPYLVRR